MIQSINALESFIFTKRRISGSIFGILVFVYKSFLLIKWGQIITKQYQFFCTGLLEQYQSREIGQNLTASGMKKSRMWIVSGFEDTISEQRRQKLR